MKIIIISLLLLIGSGCSHNAIIEKHVEPTIGECQYIFNTINKEVYFDELEAVVVLSKSLKSTVYGDCNYSNPPTIRINPLLHLCPKDKYNNTLWSTIAHEMAHVKVTDEMEKDHHGPLWRREYNKICRMTGIQSYGH